MEKVACINAISAKNGANGAVSMSFSIATCHLYLSFFLIFPQQEMKSFQNSLLPKELSFNFFAGRHASWSQFHTIASGLFDDPSLFNSTCNVITYTHNLKRKKRNQILTSFQPLKLLLLCICSVLLELS